MGVKNLTFVDDSAPQCDAAWLNSAKNETNNAISSTTQTAADGDVTQLGKAIAEYAGGGDFYTDTGAADAYVVSAIGSKNTPTSYFDGLRVRFRPANVNTGASTINVATLGVKNIKLIDGSTNPGAGDLPASEDIELVYDGTNFRLVSSSAISFVVDATTTAKGIVELSTDAELETGTDATRAVTPANVLNALNFSRSYESAEQTITASSTITLAHGLGREPVNVKIVAICKTAEFGWSIGDKIFINYAYANATAMRGVGISFDSTNVYAYISNAAPLIQYNNKTTWALADLTNANWKLIISAWG